MNRYQTLQPDITAFNLAQTHKLETFFIGLDTPNPYMDYTGFEKVLEKKYSDGDFPDFFLKSAEKITRSRLDGVATHLITGLPVEKKLPDADGLDIIHLKKRISGPFLAEKILQAYALSLDNPLLAYETRNEGAFFQDVLPSRKFYGTQTQKTDGELWPHNDRTAHVIRADLLMLHGLRSHAHNKVYTDYIDGQDLTHMVGEKHAKTLAEKTYVTPFDDFSRASNPHQTCSPAHAVIEEGNTIRYYHGRTHTLPDASARCTKAFAAFRNAVETAPRARASINVGDLFIFPNRRGLHVRTIDELQNPDLLSKRWLAKVYAFHSQASRDLYSDSYVPGKPGLVAELRL
jgi:hypothetical protein